MADPPFLARNSPKAFLWMSLSAFLFALMNFFARMASGSAPWTLVGGTRALIGAGIALWVARLRGVSIRPVEARGMWPRSLFGTAAMLCTFYALARPELPLGDTVTLLNLYPIFIAAVSPAMLGERPNRHSLLSLSFAVVGVVFILHPTIVFGGPSPRPGAGVGASVAVGASIFATFAMVSLRRIGSRETAEAVAFHFSSTAAAVFLLLSLSSWKSPDMRDLFAMIFAGVCAGFAQIAMTRAYALGEAAKVSSFGYLAVVVSALLGAFALHEWPTRMKAVGMLMVIVGGLSIAFSGVRGRQKEA